MSFDKILLGAIAALALIAAVCVGWTYVDRIRARRQLRQVLAEGARARRASAGSGA